MIDLKEYQYHKGSDAMMDAAFASAVSYGKVKLETNIIFWKVALRWFYLPLSRVQRAYRRVEEVNAKMCCGRANFDIQKLMLQLDEGTTLELYIGENERDVAGRLFQALKEAHPELQYGKPQQL